MSYDEATKTIIAVGGGLAAIGASWKWLPKACGKLQSMVAAKRNVGVVQGLRKLHNAYSAMERSQDFGATRAIIFGGHNSGGLPRVNCSYNVSAIHWFAPEIDNDRISDFTELAVDADYIEMLLSVIETGYYRYRPSNHKETSLLRQIYEAGGVRSSFICFLGVVDKTLLYISFAKTEGDDFTEEQITHLRLIAGTIARALK